MDNYLFCLVFFYPCFALCPLALGAEEETLSQKAVNQLIDSLPDFVKDVQAMRNMTPQQKLDFIINTVDGRVQDKVKDKFKDQLKDKVKEYTQAAVRARAFQEFGVPQIPMPVLGTAVNWGKLRLKF